LSLMPVPEAVRRFVELMVASHRVEPELHRVFFEQLPRDGGFEQMGASVNEGLMLAEAFLKAHAHEIAPQDHKLTAFILVHTVESLTHSAVLMQPELLRTDAFVTELTELVVGYLQPGRRARKSREGRPSTARAQSVKTRPRSSSAAVSGKRARASVRAIT